MDSDFFDARLQGDTAASAGPARQSAAAQAYLVIAQAAEVPTVSRINAAKNLARLDARAAVGVYRDIAAPLGLDLNNILTIVNLLTPLDPQVAIEVLTAALEVNLKRIDTLALANTTDSNMISWLNQIFETTAKLAALSSDKGVQVYALLAAKKIPVNHRMAAAGAIEKLEQAP